MNCTKKKIVASSLPSFSFVGCQLCGNSVINIPPPQEDCVFLLENYFAAVCEVPN
jgi:hypothetical protein